MTDRQKDRQPPGSVDGGICFNLSLMFDGRLFSLGIFFFNLFEFFFFCLLIYFFSASFVEKMWLLTWNSWT